MKKAGEPSNLKKILRFSRRFFHKKMPLSAAANECSIDTYPVRVVITGMERSGTTLLSTLLKQNSCIDGGFECGFLLADTPRDFKGVRPWYETGCRNRFHSICGV